MPSFQAASRRSDTGRFLLKGFDFLLPSDGGDAQMAIASVEGNMKHARTCLELERQELEKLDKQVFDSGGIVARKLKWGREVTE